MPNMEILDRAPDASASLMLLHAVPGRCRLRVSRLRVDTVMRRGVELRLRSSPLVSNFRLNLACESVVVEHVGTIESLFALLLTPSSPQGLDTKDASGSAVVVSPPLRNQQPLYAMGWAAAALVLGPAGALGVDTILIVLTAFPIWYRAVSTLINEKRLNVDFLDGLALAIAVLRRQPRTAALMALMVHWVMLCGN